MSEEKQSPASEGSIESVAILLALHKRGPMSYAELRAHVKLDESTSRAALTGLSMRKRIRVVDDRWHLA